MIGCGGTMMMEKYAAADTMWVLIGAFMVFFMQPGFAMVETGFTRAKNAGNIVMKNFMDLCLGSIVFWIIGFGLMFGTDIGGLIGAPDFFVQNDYGASYPSWAFFIFQTVFCATAATIVSGASRTDEVFCLLYLQYFDQRGYLSGLGALDLGAAAGLAPWVFMILPVLRRSIWSVV